MKTKSEILEDEETPSLSTGETVMKEKEETHRVKEDKGTGHLVDTLKSTLQTLPHFPTECCIYRVPYGLRRVNEEAYTPMVVSIGPFHHGKESLQEMEVQKQRYLNDFLKRRPDLDLKCHFISLEALEKRARNCYAENIPYLSSAFIKMMLLDGCFIVELFLKFTSRELRNKDDPLFKSEVMLNDIRRDLVLLENQLPFFILEHFFSLNAEWHKGNSLNKLTLDFLGEHIQGRRKKNIIVSTDEAKHIVDLSRQCYFPEKINDSVRKFISIPNATRLHESGVKFTNPSDSSEKCLLDLKFTSGITSGNLEIPPIMLDDHTETFLRNWIAFEQVDPGKTQIFTEYTCLMDCLIDTPKDVELLRKAGIMENLLGDDEEASQLFNKLGRGVVCGSRLYHQHCENVKNYCEKRRHAWSAKLKRDYFKTPWSIISVIAAAVLLITAVIQCVIAVIQCVCTFHQCKG